jgi:predicted PurR-regulated permease PerM
VTSFLRTLDRRYVVLAVLALIILVVGWVFRETLFPFLVAVFIVYLMEPVVTRLSSLRLGGLGMSRLGAVACVYAGTLALLVSFGWFFMPRLARELATFTADAPVLMQQLREERMPAINGFIERSLAVFGADEDAGFEPAAARLRVHDAVERAQAAAHAVSLVPVELRSFQVAGPTVVPSVAPDSDWGEDGRAPAIRIVAAPDGGWEIVLPDDGLSFQPQADGSWRVTRDTGPEPPLEQPGARTAFDIEAAITESLRGSVEAGGEQVGWAIEVIQHLVEGVLEALAGIFITLMVAAFLSSDVPRFIEFFYSLFPPAHRPMAARLVTRLNEGLAGVIRGQVAICIVNGVLTGIGLSILQVKFSLLLAVMAGVLSLIPIFGTIISTIPAVLVGLTHGFVTGVLVLGWILVIHFIEANILNPKILGDSAEIHPVIVVFALVAGEHYFGLIGALLAVPTASIVQSGFLFIREMLAPVEPETNPAAIGETE